MPFRTNTASVNSKKHEGLVYVGSNSYGGNVDDSPRSGVVPGSRVASSQNIRIYARLSDVFIFGEEQGTAWLEVGAIQSLKVTQSRSNEVLRGVGYGVNVDIAPSVVTYQLTATRLLTYNRNIVEAFGYTEQKLPNLARQDAVFRLTGLRALAQLSIPLEISKVVNITKSREDDAQGLSTDSSIFQDSVNQDANQIRTVYRGCQISSWSRSISLGGSTITETVNFVCTRIDRG